MQHIYYVMQVITLFLVYFFTAELGLSLDAVNRFATLVWVPTGISLAALFLGGFRLWPGIAIAAFLVNYVTGASFVAALGIAVGNTLEALIGAYLLKRMEIRSSLDRLRDVLLLIFWGAMISTMISATTGVSSLLLTGIISLSSYMATWVPWWVGDMLSNILVAPLLLIWSRSKRILPKRLGELILLLIILVFIGLIVFKGFFGIVIENSPVTYLVLPFLLWISLRFTQRESVTAVFILGAIAIWGTSEGQGPFAQGAVSPSLFYLQGFMGITAVTSLILSAVVSERREIERRKNEFISMAAHEIKTPLTSLKLYNQLLQKYLHEKNNKKALQIVKKYDPQIDKLTFLVNDLLDISKIIAGKFTLRKSSFLIDELLVEIVRTIKESNKRQKIMIEGDTKKEIYADRDRVGQVIINLLTNAIKYSPQKTPIIIHCKSSKRFLILGVQDFGFGIAKEHQEKIFDRFYQINPLEHSSPGLGVGLYLSKMIIKKHKGDMWVKSKKAKGSIFYLSLPLQ